MNSSTYKDTFNGGGNSPYLAGEKGNSAGGDRLNKSVIGNPLR
jgi:hypothetical protein